MTLLQRFFYASFGKASAMQVGVGGTFLIIGSFLWAAEKGQRAQASVAKTKAVARTDQSWHDAPLRLHGKG